MPYPTLRLRLALLVPLASLILGCEGLVPANAMPTGRNVVVADGLRMEMKWCSVSASRQAECELEMTSLLQDRKAGFAYPKLQDARGREFRLQSELQKLMVANQPYAIRLTAKNLPSDLVAVRSIVGTMVAWTPDGVHKMANEVVTFSGLPTRPAAATAPAPPAGASTSPGAGAASAPQARTLAAPGAAIPNASGTYWFGTILPVVDMPENEVMRLWRRGAYLHMREDGILGFNWSTPTRYEYLDFNRWTQTGRQVTLSMSGAVYRFDLDAGRSGPLRGFLEPGGGFEMTLAPRSAGQR